MRQRLLLKSLFLLCALIGGVLGAWAQTVTLVSGSGTSGYAVPDNWTSSGNVEGGSYLKLDGGTITSPAFAPHTSLSFTYSIATFGSGDNHPLTIRILNASTDAVIKEETTATPTSSTYISTGSPLSLGDVDVSFKIQLYGPTGKGIRLRNYSITGTPAGSGSNLKASDLALTGAPVALSFDLYNNSRAQVIHYTTSSTGAVTVSESEFVETSVDKEHKTITVTPTAVTPSAQTITVSQVADDIYDGGSVSFTVSIDDSTPTPTHTATFSVNGATTTQNFVEGADITFPENPASIDGKVFMGWVTDAIDGTQTGAPSFVTSATMGSSDVTFYAVFASVVAGSETDQSLIIDAGDHAAGFPTTYGAAADCTLSEKVFNIFQAYKNGAKFQWRAAGNSNGTGTMYNKDALTKLQSIVLTYDDSDDNKNFTIKVGSSANPSSGTAITPSNSGNVYTFDCSSYNMSYFVLTNGSGAGYLTSIVINYKEGSPDTYSNYCTTVVVPSVARPEITIAENPFLFSTTATITCDTEGATIYYRYTENDEWTEYTGALTITETTTIYAKAIKNDDESSVASVTATKNLAEPTVTVSGDLTLDLNGETNVSAGTLTATVTYNDAAVEGAAVTWLSSAPEVATIGETTGAVTLLTTGEVTFTATFSATSDYAKATGTKTVTVVNSKQPGTENSPYTVAQAIAYINTLGSSTSANEVYVSGIVSQVESLNDDNSITYWISDDGTTTNQMEVYKGKGLNGATFTSEDDLLVGDIVTVKGKVKMYNDTPEFDKNNQIVSFERVKTDPMVTFENGTVRVNKTLDLSTLFASNSPGEVTYSITAGDTYASLEGTILTGVAEGNVIVKASQAETASYNEAETTATITVEAALTLSSIAITTPPTKTNYTEGETFDPTDMVVTATYSDNSTEDVTASCTYSPTTALTTSDTEITVSYTENETTKTATQGITVKEYTQPTEVVITNWNTTFNSEYTGTVSSITDANPITGSKDNVSVTYAGGGNHYVINNQIRFYPSNKLTFEAPSGYDITKIVFTSGGTWAATISADPGTYTSSSKTWEGAASSVVFTGSGSNRCDIATATITLAPHVETYAFNFSVSPAEGGTIVVLDEEELAVTTGEEIAENAELTISATANTGYTFVGWTATAGTIDDPSKDKKAKFTMPAEDVTLSATFTINSHLLTTLTENGILAITVDGVEQTMTSDGIIVNYGQTVSITATPADNYTFNNWESDDLDEFDTAANPLIFTMPDKNIGVIANFIDANKDYDITLNQPESGATISAKVGGLNVETAKKDDKVVLSYDITGKKAFVSWTVLDDEANEVTVTYDEQNDEYSFTMPASDVEVEAEFVDIYTVDFFVNGTKDSEATYAADAAIIFPEVTAPEGLTFMGWTESVISGTQNTAPAILVTEATMGTADKTYYAVYASRSDIPSAFSEYEKVTTNPGDWSGTYLLGATYNGGSVEANKGTFVFSGFGSTIGNKVALTPGTTEYSDYEIVIAKSGSHYTLFHTSSGKYFSYSGSSNQLLNNNTVNGDNEKWDIDESGVITNVAVTSRKILYNGSNPRFACYTSVQTPTDLYKRIETGGTVYSDYCTSVPNTISVSVSDAKYATFSNGRAVDFSMTDITVYKAKVEGKAVKMIPVSGGIVPANTGVILYSETATTEDVPFTTTETSIEDNDLVATVTRTLVKKQNGSNFNYILQKDSESGKIVFNMAKEAGAYMPAGRAYLSTTVDASASNSRLSVMFADDVVTSIAGMNHETSGTANDVYDLQGRKVDTSLMKKGLYIVRSGKNARKVVK